MDENLELEQDIDVETDEATDDFDVEVEEADVDEEADETDDESVEETSEDDEELEYDDEGNVITAEDDETVAEEKEGEQTVESGTADEGKPDTHYDDLKKKYDDRESLIRDVLKTIGIDEKDLDQGLAKIAADFEGDSVEDFLKKRAEKQEAEAAQNFYKKMLLDKMVAEDMQKLHSQFPELKSVTKFADLPNARRYAELRDLGLSVEEAYNAANPGGRRDAITNSVKQQAINASKAHLKSNVPIASRDNSVKITRAEMQQMRDIFPDMSDKEIIALYKKTK